MNNTQSFERIERKKSLINEESRIYCYTLYNMINDNLTVKDFQNKLFF